MRKITIILIGLFVFISGCLSTGGIPIAREEIPVLSGEKGRVIFYRTRMTFGSGMQPAIFLDGKKVGVSASGTAFYVDVRPGKHLVSIAKILYSGAEGGVGFEIQANEVVYIRTWTGGGSLAGRTDAGVMDTATAEGHVKGIKFLRFDFKE